MIDSLTNFRFVDKVASQKSWIDRNMTETKDRSKDFLDFI